GVAPESPARGRNDRIRRGAPSASLDMIDMPSETASCSVDTDVPLPVPGSPGSTLPGGVAGDAQAARDAAIAIDGMNRLFTSREISRLIANYDTKVVMDLRESGYWRTVLSRGTQHDLTASTDPSDRTPRALARALAAVRHELRSGFGGRGRCAPPGAAGSRSQTSGIPTGPGRVQGGRRGPVNPARKVTHPVTSVA